MFESVCICNTNELLVIYSKECVLYICLLSTVRSDHICTELMTIGKKLSPKGILKKSQDLIRQRDIIDMLSIFWIVIYVYDYSLGHCVVRPSMITPLAILLSDLL
jgi:hypothetical protein